VNDPQGAADELDVSVVLPVFNEVGHVLQEVTRIRAALEASPYSFEIIVVDDCSTDGSVEQLEGVDGIRLIRSAKNRGSGAVRRIGTRAAKGRVVVWTDADMSYPNEEIPRLVKELEGFDQVVGARTSEQGRARFFRVPAKWSIRKLASYLTDTKIPDLNSGLRAFRRDVGLQYVHLLPSGFSCVTTITMTFLANGYSVKYVPIEYRARAGYSKFHWWTDTRRYFVQVLRMVLTYDPLRIFVPASLVLGVPGVGKLVFDLVTKDLRIATNTLLLVFAALQLLVIGLLADLVVRLARPSDEVDPA
jgi:glycosyltransferase involved in cell wall biosynthesis